ncbi:UNVERIFIED_CONTAM: hypothetical protein FKN15_006961 [Acipenser sinensis]
MCRLTSPQPPASPSALTLCLTAGTLSGTMSSNSASAAESRMCWSSACVTKTPSKMTATPLFCVTWEG